MKKTVVILLSLFFINCASRKVDISKSVETIKTDSSLVIKIDGTYIKENNIFTSESIDEVEYKPIDSLKPMVIDGKSYKNTIIKSKKKKDVKIYKTKAATKVSSVKKLNVKREESKKVIAKKIDKKANYLGYLWFLIPIVIIILLERYGRSLFTLSR